VSAAFEELVSRARARGTLSEARRELDAAVARGAGKDALLARAEVLSDLGYVVEALADVGRALELGGPDAALYARRAQYCLQRRNYPEALADLDRAVALAPKDAWLRARRADAYKLTDALSPAQRDLDAAVKLAPSDEGLRLARLRLLVERGKTKEAAAEIARLLKGGSTRAKAEAVFYRGAAAFKSGAPGRGEKDFKTLMKDLPESDPLSMRARFYWAASRAVDERFRKRHAMKTKKEKAPHLFLCGLGIFPPYTASLEVLHAISRSDVIFNNLAGSEVREFLAEFCRDIRPAAYQAWQDEPAWADAIFSELDKGKKVAFVTRGHPLVFGGLAVELIRRCKANGLPHECFGAVSSIDHLLAFAGKGLGDDFGGIQAVDFPAFAKAKVHNTELPLLLCFYSGLEDRAAVARTREALERFYPKELGCWMFGPKYDSPPAVVTIGELDRRYSEVHPSLMLYVPAFAAEAVKA
jgi:tetratricopeptide (TPR) repeat protein